jgi:sarcosine oxidase subunit alpha
VSRLPVQPGELLDRDTVVRFDFQGKPVEAFAGDTFGSALYASGRTLLSRSFKYHRPRGILCCKGHCANCMMTVDGTPNVRVCETPVREGAVVEGQNVIGSLDRDLFSVVDKLGGPFTPVGFYYRTMIRPRRMWPLYEKLLRNAAGLGKVPEHDPRYRYDVEHRDARVLVIGGGRAGREAAAAHAAEGSGVVLVDELPELALELPGVEVLAPARAIGIWEGGLVPVEYGRLMLRYRAEHVVVATGTVDQPLVFPGNDLVGVMLPGAVERLVERYAVKPGERAVVIAAGGAADRARAALDQAGIEIVGTVELTEDGVPTLAADGRKGRVRSVAIDGRTVDCDLVVMTGGRQPAYSLLAMAGAKVEYDAARGVLVPTAIPDGISATGSVTGAVGEQAVPAAAYSAYENGGDKCFVCVCEDVSTKDVKRAVAEGFDSIELAKRYTTVTMGPCQGRYCHVQSIRLYAKETGSDEAAIGATTARPPWTPVSMGLLAGRHLAPLKRASLHHRHEEAGASLIWAGAWKRPHSYGDVEREVRAVHEDLGVIDVSTLGKLLVQGPDAAAFLERLYPNRFGDIQPGRIRYGVLTTDGGRIMDDGTVARLAESSFYVTTTSTGADAVNGWFEWWNAIWGYDVEIANVTGALAAVNLAGPRAREALGALTDAPVSNEDISYLDAKELTVAGVPCLALRIGFVGELGYELHCPSPAAERLWDAIVGEGAVPFGLEPQRVLRLEKAHVIVGQDTDSESNLISAGMPWIAKLDKDDWVGKRATELVLEGGVRERLVGFEMENGKLPAEGGQVVENGRPAGRVTSARWSAALAKNIGLAWVSIEAAEEGTRIQIRVDGRPEPAIVRHGAFYDPEGTRLRS